MPGCSALCCTNRTEQGYKLKVFPKDPKRRKLWASKVKRLDWEPTDNSYLCEIHFDKNQWETARSGKKKLKKDAVPLLFDHATVPTERKPPMIWNDVLTAPEEETATKIDLRDELNKAQAEIKKELKEDPVPLLFDHVTVPTERKPPMIRNDVLTAPEEETATKIDLRDELNKANAEIKKELKEDAVPLLFDYATVPTERQPPIIRNDVLTAPEEETATKIDLRDELNKAKAEIMKLKTENLRMKFRLRKKTLETYALKLKLNKRANAYKKIFNEDQMKVISKCKVSKWSNETVKTALGLRLSCGTSGYNALLSANLPFPSTRTLQRRIEGIKFPSEIRTEKSTLRTQ